MDFKDIIFGVGRFFVYIIVIVAVVVFLAKTNNMPVIVPDYVTKHILNYYDTAYSAITGKKSIPDQVSEQTPSVAKAKKQKKPEEATKTEENVQIEETKGTRYISDSYLTRMADYLFYNGINYKFEKQAFWAKENIEKDIKSYMDAIDVLAGVPFIKEVFVSSKSKDKIYTVKSYLDNYVKNYKQIVAVELLDNKLKSIARIMNSGFKADDIVITKNNIERKDLGVFKYKDNFWIFKRVNSDNGKNLGTMVFCVKMNELKVMEEMINNFALYIVDNRNDIIFTFAKSGTTGDVGVDSGIKAEIFNSGMFALKYFNIENTDWKMAMVYQRPGIYVLVVSIIRLLIAIGIIAFLVYLFTRLLIHVKEMKEKHRSPYEMMSGAIVEAVKSAQTAAQAAAAASENAKVQAETIKNISQNISPKKSNSELFKEPPPAMKWRV